MRSTKSQIMLKTITLLGRPASKKNNRRNFGHISLPSLAYGKFEQSALWQLKSERMDKPFDQPIHVDYVFYQKGKMTQDFDNAIASINDVLQKAEIITDDRLIKLGSFKVINGAKDWKTDILIGVILSDGWDEQF